jgi:hypothetical protein
VAELFYRLSVVLLDKQRRKESIVMLNRALDLDYTKHQEVFEYAPVLQNDAEILSLISSRKN